MWCGREDSNPHEPLSSTDFLAVYGFRRPRHSAFQRKSGFGVWTIPSPCPGSAPGETSRELGPQFLSVASINVPGSEPIRHAVLSAGARFEFRVTGRSYVLSVLRLAAGTAAMRLDRRS